MTNLEIKCFLPLTIIPGRKFTYFFLKRRLHKSKTDRAPLMAQLYQTSNYDVCLTRNEMVKTDGIKNKKNFPAVSIG
jgi:hypothetical protein